MKNFIVAVVAIVAAGAVSASAQVKAFQVNVKGTITRDAGKIKITNASLLTSSANSLVLVVNTANLDINLVEVDPVTTNVVNFIWRNFRAARLQSGKFNSDLEANANNMNDPVTNFPAGTPSFEGDVQVTGKAVLTGSGKTVFGGTLVGVWTDPVALLSEVAALFKGTIKSVTEVPVPNGF